MSDVPAEEPSDDSSDESSDESNDKRNSIVDLYLKALQAFADSSQASAHAQDDSGDSEKPEKAFEQLDSHDDTDDSEASSEANDKRKDIKLKKAKAKVKKLKQKIFDKKVTTCLRIGVAAVCVLLVGFQLWKCDELIRDYVLMQVNKNVAVPSEVLIAWMSASVVEVIGLVWVIARSLFPFHDGPRNKAAEKKKRWRLKTDDS